MSSRKEFIAAGSLFAVTPALAEAAAPAATRKHAAETHVRLRPARFNAILAKTAKHKQCFGATKIAEGAGSMQTAAVLYHGAPSRWL